MRRRTVVLAVTLAGFAALLARSPTRGASAGFREERHAAAGEDSAPVSADAPVRLGPFWRARRRRLGLFGLSRRCRLAVLVAVGITALAGARAAWAYFTASTPGANAEGVAALVGRVSGLALAGNSSPTANPDIALAWQAATLSNGHPVDGYLVTRSDRSTATAACGSSVQDTGCTDHAVPDGMYSYGIRAYFASWTGEESGRVSIVVDTSAPTVAANAASASTTPTFAFAHPHYSHFVCRLDGTGDFSAGSCTPAGLAPGSHVLAVKAQADDGSLTSAATYTWTVKTAPPKAAEDTTTNADATTTSTETTTNEATTQTTTATTATTTTTPTATTEPVTGTTDTSTLETTTGATTTEPDTTSTETTTDSTSTSAQQPFP
jgi:hypothetical protein